MLWLAKVSPGGTGAGWGTPQCALVGLMPLTNLPLLLISLITLGTEWATEEDREGDKGTSPITKGKFSRG